jgi:hypothetical protein
LKARKTKTTLRSPVVVATSAVPNIMATTGSMEERVSMAKKKVKGSRVKDELHEPERETEAWRQDFDRTWQLKQEIRAHQNKAMIVRNLVNFIDDMDVTFDVILEEGFDSKA